MLLDELGEWGLQAAPSRAVPHTPASGDRKGKVSLSGQACATSLLLVEGWVTCATLWEFRWWGFPH